MPACDIRPRDVDQGGGPEVIGAVPKQPHYAASSEVLEDLIARTELGAVIAAAMYQALIRSPNSIVSQRADGEAGLYQHVRHCVEVVLRAVVNCDIGQDCRFAHDAGSYGDHSVSV